MRAREVDRWSRSPEYEALLEEARWQHASHGHHRHSGSTSQQQQQPQRAAS